LFATAKHHADRLTRQFVLCVGSVGQQLPRALGKYGLGVLVLDGLNAKDPDLWQRDVRLRVQGWLKGGCVTAVVVGRPQGEASGNQIVKNAAEWTFAAYTALLRCGLQQRVPAVAILPAHSELWRLSATQSLLRQATSDVLADSCQWGCRWRTRLRLVGWSCPLRIDELLCGGKRYRCSRTHRAHLPVRHGSWESTEAAGPVPPRLAARVASALVERMDDLHSNKLNELLKW